LDEKLLTQLAESTGGQYFRARDAEEMERNYATLDTLEPIQGEGQKLRPLTSLFFLPLGIALIITSLYALIYLFSQWLSRSSTQISGEQA
jgi:Ca-activated chloride channel family protein